MIRGVERHNYHIAGGPHPRLHREMAWYATDDDKVLGGLILDLVDRDYGYVVLTKNPATDAYECVDVECSFLTAALATRRLHQIMEGLQKNEQ